MKGREGRYSLGNEPEFQYKNRNNFNFNLH